MKKLKVDLKELVSEMEMGENMELTGYLDTETGELISMPDDMMRAVEEGRTESLVVDWDDDLAEVAEKILGDEKNRFLLIPKRESREGYEIMASFAGSVSKKDFEKNLQLLLTAKAHSGGSGACWMIIPMSLRNGMRSRTTGCGKKQSSGSLRTTSSRNKA